MQETFHESYLRMGISDELRNSCSVTLSLQEYLRLVNKHLKTIFGPRADWAKNLALYNERIRTDGSCRIVRSLDDMPELTFADLLRWTEEENAYRAEVRKLQELLSKFNLVKTPDEIHAVFDAALILGLFDDDDGRMYSHLINWEGMAKKESGGVLENIKSHFGELSVAVRMLCQLQLEGLLVSYPVIETVMTQQKQRYYYRGENAFYGSSLPSGFRPVKGQSSILTARLNDLRRNEGCYFLNNFKSVINWPNSAVNHIALIQHYGLKTEMLDFSSDIMAALFFATCCFENGKWRPLRDDEIADAESRPYINEMGGDSRYAVLFRKSSEITDMEWAMLDDDKIRGRIFPVGYQPFMRCANQHAYGIFATDNKYDLYKDEQFEKFKIRLTEELCQWVFAQSNEGRNIYPNHDVPDLSYYFEKINKTHYFSDRSFMDIMQHRSKEEICRVKKELERCGYHISRTDVRFISKKDSLHINDEYPLERAIILSGINPQAYPLINIAVT